jgi:hypothetical protein
MTKFWSSSRRTRGITMTNASEARLDRSVTYRARDREGIDQVARATYYASRESGAVGSERPAQEKK